MPVAFPLAMFVCYGFGTWLLVSLMAAHQFAIGGGHIGPDVGSAFGSHDYWQSFGLGFLMASVCLAAPIIGFSAPSSLLSCTAFSGGYFETGRTQTEPTHDQ